MRSYGLCCIFFVLLMTSLSLARDVAVITDKANASSTVSSKDLLKYLKAETVKWPDGKKVTVYLSDLASADGKLLLEKTYKMTPFEVKNFAHGQNGNIVILGSDDLVLKAVAANPGAIGIVDVYSINSAIKVLKVDGKLPLERGYLLHGN